MHIRLRLFAFLFSAFAMDMSAGNIQVQTLRVTAPHTLQPAIMLDSTDVYGNPHDTEALLLSCLPDPQLWKRGSQVPLSAIQSVGQDAVRLGGFTLQNTRFAQVAVQVKGMGKHQVYIDGELANGQMSLIPGRHEVALKFITKANSQDTLSICIESEQEEWIDVNPEGKRFYTLHDVLDGERPTGVAISPSGRFLHVYLTTTFADSHTSSESRVIDLQTGKTLPQERSFLQWSTEADVYISKYQKADLSYEYQWIDPLTGNVVRREQCLQPKEMAYVLPGERNVLLYLTTSGPREDADIYQTLTPDDRQPGWRDRYNLSLLSLQDGTVQPLTQGQHKVYSTPSRDGRQLLLTITEDRLTARPTTVSTFIKYDIQSATADTLVLRGEFIGGGQFSPDGKHVLFTGSPEAFGGIGRTTEAIPSMIQTELFIMDIATRQVRSITREFDPNVIRAEWCQADGNIYALCENGDRQDIFRIDPRSGMATILKLSENYVRQFAIARDKGVLTYYGQSESNADRLYTVDLRTGREKLVLDESSQRLGDIQLGECKDWSFRSHRGDTITGRYYLPPSFDATQCYPMIVYYYGGCSPTGRLMESRYPLHAYAALGYVVYVIQPSGATGFGQEFASRHVNAYGDWTADDIIQGTRQFCREHAFVDSTKIGCVGASYGGFMTMYLQTQTDLFAAAVSHAGISNPTSYWGFGYWGYNYSEVSAAGSYPWNNPELYTQHAPLFNADKVHTPLLFVHGDSDHNVPYMESVQMFTALKLLGRETALVTVEGQDHQITDYMKRIKWQNTIWAWFARYLQGDDTWWNALYPPKRL